MNKLLFIPIILTLFIILQVPMVKAVHNPCEGGTGDIYCRGYHDGAVQADDDYNNHGFIDQSKHPCNSGAEYCAGYSKGYEDEGNFYG